MGQRWRMGSQEGRPAAAGIQIAVAAHCGSLSSGQQRAWLHPSPAALLTAAERRR